MKRFIFYIVFFSTFIYAEINVAVSIMPQKFFVEKIAGDLANIEVMVPPGSSPATYSVKPGQLKDLKKASVYFSVGVPFEKAWLKRFHSVNKKLIIADTSKYIKKIPMETDHHHEEEHEHNHEHGSLDPHIWLAPPLAILQARVILENLVKLDPKNSAVYFKNYNDFVKECAYLDTRIFQAIRKIPKKEFIVYHPSFGYFAKLYGLKQIAIEKEGKEPGMKHLKEIIDFAKKKDIKVIFAEPQFPKKSADFIAKKIGGIVLLVDPLAYEWDKNLLKVVEAFEKAGNKR
ncbi:metal ABC transporter solute-binding protein, Zn/Mn family [Nitrosophilus alvini]|uniref:metal ABC transporter solute-binding protein, Zn/Mn family n=1 Tax=Nitrosophilus alvini TaxID=2714855 RepID=UPI00190B335A|nr:zinc ABC transporter substrate-binding protein [Nitrosophilus alvini]